MIINNKFMTQCKQAFILSLIPLLTSISELPVPLPAPSGSHSIAICTSGSLIGFGNNNSCQMGNGSTSFSVDPPVAVSSLTNVVATSTGAGHTLALKDDGSVWVWGFNNQGQSAQSGTADVCSPTQVSSLGCAVAVSAGGAFSMALMADGTIYTWGSNSNGQLGSGSMSPSTRYTPAQVTGITNAIAISAGYQHAMALLDDGTVKVWGYGYDGQMGNGTSGPTASNNPTPISPTLAGVVRIEAGGNHNLALQNAGKLYVWGDNLKGQLGLGDYTDRTVPTSSSISSGTIIDMAAGIDHTIILNSNGTLRVCGNSVKRQLGICSGGTYNTGQNGPSISGIVDVQTSSSFDHNLAITSSGALYTWGNNDAGQLGVGTGPGYECNPQHVNYSGSGVCSVKPSVDVQPQPCCVAIQDEGRTTLEGSYAAGSMSYYSQNLALTGPITLTSGNHYLVDCDVVCESDASITINSGAKLFIQSGSHLYACGDMWQGIDAKTGSRISVQSSSLIEDAEVAVDVEYGALYNINTAIFNKNYTHFYKHMPSGSVGGLTGDYVIAKSKFLCQTTASIGGTPVHTTLLAPHAGQRTDVALLAVGVPKLLVGNTNAANANTVDNANWGIFDWTVGRVQVMHNILRDIGNGGVYAVYGPGAGGETIDIIDNDFLRMPYPVFCYDNDHTVRSHINYNFINFDGMGTPPPTGMTGITYEEITPASGGNLNYVDISGNTIYKAPTGIRLANLLGDNNNQKASIYVFDNNITHQQAQGEQGAGIRLENVVQSSVVDNDISHPTSATNWWETAIRSTSGSNGNGFYCNYIHHIGNGMLFEGYQTTNTTVANNDFEVNHRAFMINWGDVGPQPNGTGIPHDNEWIDTSYWDVTNYKYTTQVLGTHTHTTSFDVRTAAPSVYYPNDNNIYDLGGYPIPLSVIGNSWQYGCVVNGLHANFKTDGSEEVTEQPDYTSITEPTAAQSEREANQQWIAQYGLYGHLKRNSSVAAENVSLSNFLSENIDGNIGKLQRILGAFNQSEGGTLQQEAASNLVNIQPMNSVEQTLKDVLTVLYDNAGDMHNMSEETTAQLREIAIRCPLDDGMGVYMARAALLKVDTLPKNYTNECEQIPHSDEAKNKTSEGNTSDWMVYPNPNNGQLVIEHNMALDEVGIVEVFDLSGRTVYQAKLQPSSSNQVLQMEGLQPGLYLLRAVANGSVKLSEQISVIK